MIWSCTIPSVSFGARHVLSAQQATFTAGVTSLVGRNGAGKTTLFESLMMISRTPATSQLAVAGRVIPSSDRAVFMHEVGYLPQDVPAPRSMRTEQFVAHAAWLKGLDDRRARQKASDALEVVNLESHAHTRMSELSGGMRRRAGLAAAIVHDPTILMLDEPTSGFDPLERARFHELITSLAAERIAVISTHLLEDIHGLGGQVALLSEGQLRALGKVQEVEARESLTDYLLPLLIGENKS